MTRQIVEVEFDDPRAVVLRQQMSDEMADLYGAPRHGAGAEGIDRSSVLVCLLVLDDDVPVATATLRRLRDLVEIKRMFVKPQARGTGLARRLLAAVEAYAAEVTDRVVLHTGLRQRPAIGLYERSGYTPIEVFAPYDEVPESVCFVKILDQDVVP